MASSGSLLSRAYGTTQGGCQKWNYQRWKIAGREYVIPNPDGVREPPEVQRIVDQKTVTTVKITYKDDDKGPYIYTISDYNQKEMDDRIARDRQNALRRQNNRAKKQRQKRYNNEDYLKSRQEKKQKPSKKLMKEAYFEYKCFDGYPVVRLLKESVYKKKVKDHKKKHGKGKRKPRQSCDQAPTVTTYCYCLNKDPQIQRDLRNALNKLIKANRIPCEGQVFESMRDLKNAQFTHPTLERAKNRDKSPRDYYISWVEDCQDDPLHCTVKTTPPGQDTIKRSNRTNEQTAYLKKG